MRPSASTTSFSFSFSFSFARILAAAVLGASLCLASPARAQSAPTGPPPASAPWTVEATTVDGLQVEYALRRVPAPRATVVFENGLMLRLETWNAVATALGDCCDLLAYHRAGVGLSALPDEAEPPARAAARLHGLLDALSLPAPYLAVGHSLGGQYAQRFAMAYPDQVGALLLVDALPPGLVRPWDDFPWFTRTGLWLFAPTSARREIAAISALGEPLLARPGFFTGPVIRLVADPDPRIGPPEGLVRDLLKGVVLAADFGVWAQDPDEAERHMDLVLPQSEVRHLAAHHRVQEQHPEVVVAAIHALLDRLPAAAASAPPPPPAPTAP